MNETRERNYNVKLPTRFRYAFVLKPGHYDFSSLKPFCDRFIYATDGYADSAGAIREQLEQVLVDFDANKDILVPVGSASICTQAGGIIVRRCMEPQHKWGGYVMAIYSGSVYEFWRIPLDREELAYSFVLSENQHVPQKD